MSWASCYVKNFPVLFRPSLDIPFSKNDFSSLIFVCYFISTLLTDSICVASLTEMHVVVSNSLKKRIMSNLTNYLR